MTQNENEWTDGTELTLAQILERPLILPEGEKDAKEDAAAEEPDVVKSYLQEIRKVPLLNAQSEKVLAAAAEDGDDGARRHLIEANTADQALPTRLPVHVHEMRSKALRAKESLSQKLGRDPEPWEIAEATGLDVSKIEDLQRLAYVSTSLDLEIDEEGNPLANLIPDPNGTDPQAESGLPADVLESLARLEERERMVLELRFGLTDGEGKTLDEIGRRVGLTREGVRQIEKRALEKLRRDAA